MRIAVISMHGKPLSPTTPAKARKLIKSGGAIPQRDKLGTFYIQLTTPTGEVIPHDTVVGIDPGKRYSGVGVQTPQATLWMGHLVLPFSQVKQAMKSRRQSRRFRRYRKTPQRPIRFRHRTGHKIPPSIKANRELEWRVLYELAKIYPITHVVYEVVKARGTQSFSPVMVGQQWQMDRIAQKWPLIPRRGWETAQLRFALDLKKTSKKAQRSPASHAVDGVALASSHFLQYVPYETATEHGQRWEGRVASRTHHLPSSNGHSSFAGHSISRTRSHADSASARAGRSRHTVCARVIGWKRLKRKKPCAVTSRAIQPENYRWPTRVGIVSGNLRSRKSIFSGGQRGCSSRRFRPLTAND